MTLVAPVAPGDSVTVTYTPPGAADNPLQDASGNAVATFTIPNDTVTQLRNNSPPALQRVSVEGATVTLTFNGELDGDSVPAEDAFKVRVDASEVDLASADPVDIDGSTVTLTLAEPVGGDSRVEVRYVNPGAENNPLQGAGSGIAVETFDFTEANNTTTPPALQSITVGGATVTLTFDSELDGNSVPAKDAFTVRVDASEVDLAAANPVAVDGSTVTLTLAEAVGEDSEVEVRYTNPGAGNNPLRDAASGIAVETFDFTAAVNTTDTAAPTLTADGAGIAGRVLTLTFDEDLDEESEPAPGAFEVSVDGNRRLVESSRSRRPHCAGDARRAGRPGRIGHGDLFAPRKQPAAGRQRQPRGEFHHPE